MSVRHNSAEKKENETAHERTEFVFTAKRGNGVFTTHMHERVHHCGAVRRETGKETESLQQIRDVPWCSAVDKAFRFVQDKG